MGHLTWQPVIGMDMIILGSICMFHNSHHSLHIRLAGYTNFNIGRLTVPYASGDHTLGMSIYT